MGSGGVKQLDLSGNVLAAHVQSGTSQPFSFSRCIFHPVFMDAGQVVLLFHFHWRIGNVAVRLMLRII